MKRYNMKDPSLDKALFLNKTLSLGNNQVAPTFKIDDVQVSDNSQY